MKKILTFLLIYSAACFAQTGPWQSPLMIATSSNGTIFTTPAVFQDSSGVPSIIRIGSPTSDTLMAAFQWFPAPKFSTYWDKIAVKFSYNGGISWTSPTSCTFTGMPGGFQRPFDPSLVQLSPGQIRMFFPDGLNSPPAGGIDSYSAFSNDGITYTFEPAARFDDLTKQAIDPSIVNFGGNFFYNSWTGNQSDGAFRAISNNGITFTTQTTYTFDGMHLWLGNYMVDGSTLKFYGSGSPGNIWFNSSANGITWNGYISTNIGMAADPAVVKNKSGVYVMLYTGPPAVTGINESYTDTGIKLFPNCFSHHITVKSDLNEELYIEIIDINGKVVHTAKSEKDIQATKINLSHLSNGVYHCRVSGEKTTITRKIIKAG